MKTRKNSRFIGHCLNLCLLVTLSLIMVACSSETASSTTTESSNKVTLLSITISPSKVPDLAVNGSRQFISATANYSDDSAMDVTTKVTWASSDTSVAAITATGLAIGKAPGTTNITASWSGMTSQPVILTVK